MDIRTQIAAGRTQIPSDPREQIAYFADPGNQIIDKLQSISTGVSNDPAGYIGSLLAPDVEVTSSAGEFYRWNVRAHDDAQERPLKGVPHEVDTKISKQRYDTVEYSLQEKVDRREVSAYPGAMDAAVSNVTEMLMISREIRVKTLLNTSGNFNSTHRTTLSGTSQWSDRSAGVSDPLTQRDAAILAISRAIFRPPNVFWCGPDVFLALTRHPVLVAANNVPNVRELSVDDLAKQLRVERVLVGNSYYNSANEIDDTDTAATGAGIWDGTAGWGYVPPAPGMRVPALAYTLALKGMTVDSFPDPLAPKMNQVVQVTEEMDELMAISSGKAGYLVLGAI